MTVNMRVMKQWQELIQIAAAIDFSDEPDQIIWKFSFSGRFSYGWLLKIKSLLETSTKRRRLDDKSSLFCSDHDSLIHLFF
jgi:hypothetical protein